MNMQNLIAFPKRARKVRQSKKIWSRNFYR